MNTKKRIIAAILSLIMTIGLFSGCSATSKGKVAKDPPKAIVNSAETYVEKALDGNSLVKTFKSIAKNNATYAVEIATRSGKGLELSMVANGSKSSSTPMCGKNNITAVKPTATVKIAHVMPKISCNALQPFIKTSQNKCCITLHIILHQSAFCNSKFSCCAQFL